MLRPPGSHEVRWLAVALVRASVALNRSLGLDPRAQNGQEPLEENVFQVWFRRS